MRQLLGECRCLFQVPVPCRVLGSDLGRSWSALMLVTLDRSLPPSVRGFSWIDVSANAPGDVIGILPELLGVTHMGWGLSHIEECHFLQFEKEDGEIEREREMERECEREVLECILRARARLKVSRV